MFGWLMKRKSIPSPTEETEYVRPAERFDDTEAEALLKEIRKEFGLDYRKQKRVTLRKIERFCKHHGITSFAELQKEVLSQNPLKEKLLNTLTVGETYFYREVEQFRVLGRLIIENPSASILSAPCSSGEEVYSILLHTEEHNIPNQQIRIVGIDINTDTLTKAKIGCFSRRSVSHLPYKLLKEAFRFGDERYCIDESYKERVRFLKKNVFEIDSGDLGKFDIIISRNMLIYFDDEEKRRVLEKFYRLLQPGGYLFLGHADINFSPAGFLKIFDRNVIYYRKEITL